jgi:hypothetical protein
MFIHICEHTYLYVYEYLGGEIFLSMLRRLFKAVLGGVYLGTNPLRVVLLGENICRYILLYITLSVYKYIHKCVCIYIND